MHNNARQPRASTADAVAAGARALGAAGAVMAAAAIGLSAYAAHGGADGARAGLQTAGWFALAHGVALAALAPRAAPGVARSALVAMLLGAVLFCGSLAAAHFLGTPTVLAPFGGGLMMLAWLAYAFDAARR